MIDKNIGEKHGKLTILTRSIRPSNGYLNYYWAKCDCGNIERHRYDRIRRLGSCGKCEDFIESEVLKALEVNENGKE